MLLSKENLVLIDSTRSRKPLAETFTYPEKVLQFGTGVLLRALPDFYIHQANQQGVFKGRVVVVKSTAGVTLDFEKQNNLYTICIRGIEQGNLSSDNLISSAISRVLSAQENWAEVMQLATSEDLSVVISNTTEIGIQYEAEKVETGVPHTFPAKLLAVLYARYQAFQGDLEKGLIILPTELIPDNAKKLAAILLQLAQFNGLDEAFTNWLVSANSFCNTLVDRIVPGKPEAEMLAEIEAELGYSDALLAMAEPYSLWAIEGDEKVKEVLSFAQVNEGIIICPDIEIYRELKVRLLNGTHTLCSGIAVLAGIQTVKEGMKQADFLNYMNHLIHEEISLSIPYEVSQQQVSDFAATVLDRFSNPFIEHLWQQISFQYSLKMKIRVIPMLLKYVNDFNKLPVSMCFGVAAFLRFMQLDQLQGSAFSGAFKNISYHIKDDNYEFFKSKSDLVNPEIYIQKVLSDKEFWGADLTSLPGLLEQVIKDYVEIEKLGVLQAYSRFSLV